VSIFEGACYTTPLIGAVFADSLWGRYKTILVFSFIYLAGIFLLTLSSWPPMGAMPGPDEQPGWFAYAMLFR
jgi:peptide/histidine transporter 3/4